jgi:ribosomal protein S18 acetylase RimI-like enzyme
MLPSEQPADSQVQRVPEPHCREALSLILTGRLHPEASAVDTFLEYTREQGYPLTHLHGLYEKGHLSSAAIALPAPGKGAMLFISPVGGRRRIELMRPLVEATVEVVGAQGVRFVQGLLDPEQTLERRLLEAADFAPLAKLVYLRRSIEPPNSITHPGIALADHHVELRPWNEDDRGLFEQAILASYQDTLDCPGLVGKRPISDVLAGHRATGHFLPEHWGVLLIDGQAAGALLVNALPSRDAMELVYVGLAKPWRGRGLGGQLIRQAITWAQRRRVASLYLAVDEQNTPAMAMYRAAGFRAQTRKIALLRMIAAE